VSAAECEIGAMTPTLGLAAFMKEERARWGKVIRKTGIALK
jgi:hypothetical protein